MTLIIIRVEERDRERDRERDTERALARTPVFYPKNPTPLRLSERERGRESVDTAFSLKNPTPIRRRPNSRGTPGTYA
jgi:hypothetical protein